MTDRPRPSAPRDGRLPQVFKGLRPAGRPAASVAAATHGLSPRAPPPRRHDSDATVPPIRSSSRRAGRAEALAVSPPSVYQVRLAPLRLTHAATPRCGSHTPPCCRPSGCRLPRRPPTTPAAQPATPPATPHCSPSLSPRTPRLASLTCDGSPPSFAAQAVYRGQVGLGESVRVDSRPGESGARPSRQSSGAAALSCRESRMRRNDASSRGARTGGHVEVPLCVFSMRRQAYC